MQDSISQELLSVVDESDKVIGVEKRGIIHAKGLLHRAVHILVFNPKGEIYLQKRSMRKDSSPGKWDSSSSGHVDAGEEYLQSAVRELDEELGISVSPYDLKSITKLLPTAATGMEFTMIYETTTDQMPCPNPTEISAGRWLLRDQLQSWIEESPTDFASCFLEVWKAFQNQ